MVIAPIAPVPPTVRGVGFIPASVPPQVPQAPQALFVRALETSAATGAPLPSTIASSVVGGTEAVSLLDRALFRDLVSAFDATTAANGVAQPGLAPLIALDPDSVLGGGALPDALRNMSERQAGVLAAALVSLFGTIQALGDEAEDTTPRLGSLLSIAA